MTGCTQKNEYSLSTELCASCGLCCNGGIFGDVELRPEDDRARLRSLGLRIKSSVGGQVSKFLQPCLAHDGCKCRIYSERPAYCRQFECLLLKNVLSGAIEKTTATRLIQEARQKLLQINECLLLMGNRDETVAHRVRFHQVARRMGEQRFSRENAAHFSKLTILVHELNVLLAEYFYPGAQK
jgi:Fe-S-cluster containining protein